MRHMDFVCTKLGAQGHKDFSSRSTYSEEVFWTHGSQLGKGLDGEDGREEVVALLQQVPKEWGPVVKALLLEIPSLGNSDEI